MKQRLLHAAPPAVLLTSLPRKHPRHAGQQKHLQPVVQLTSLLKKHPRHAEQQKHLQPAAQQISPKKSLQPAELPAAQATSKNTQ